MIINKRRKFIEVSKDEFSENWFSIYQYGRRFFGWYTNMAAVIKTSKITWKRSINRLGKLAKVNIKLD